MPEVGEVRSVGGVSGRWDGSAWQRVEAPKPEQPTLRSRTGQLYQPPAESGLKEFAGGALQAVNPMNLVRLAESAYKDPGGMLKDVAMSPVHLASGMLNQPAETLGNLTGAMVAPKLAASGLRGVNSAADAIATNPSVRSGIGYVGGAGTALATGVGHPFMGAAVGRMLSPMLKGPAQELASGSDWLLNKLGLKGGEAAADVGGLKPADMTMLQQIESRNQAIAGREAQAPTMTTTNASPFEAEFPMGVDAAKPAAPKMKFSGADVVRIQRLMEQGLTPEQAAARVSGTSTMSRLVKIGPETQ